MFLCGLTAGSPTMYETCTTLANKPVVFSSMARAQGQNMNSLPECMGQKQSKLLFATKMVFKYKVQELWK